MMKRGIENQFFEAYQPGGVVNDCIEVIMERYDLSFLPSCKPLPAELQKQITTTLQEKIMSDAKMFDDTVITDRNSPLIDEISDNLSTCITIRDRDNYIHSLLIPFKELTDLLFPEGTLKKRIDNEIDRLKKDKKYWERLTDEDSVIEGKNLALDVTKNEVKEQLQAIEDAAKDWNDQYELAITISEHFKRIRTNPNDEVEKIFNAFCDIKELFTNKLSALLLQNGIDLRVLQKDCGTYLKTDETFFGEYLSIGSLELTEKYISELPSNLDVKKENAEKKNQYNGISQALMKYIAGANDEELLYIIKHKKLPNESGKKIWTGTFSSDCVRFADYYNMTIKQWNACFAKADRKKVTRGSKPRDEYKTDAGECEIVEIMKRYPPPK